MNQPTIKMIPRTVYDVEFPDGSTLIMDQVDCWPEGLIRLRDMTTAGDAMVVERDRSEGGSLSEAFSEAFGFIQKGSVLYASPRLTERLNPEEAND